MAQLPSQRRLGWLCEWLHTTPADPRLLDMTEEQANDLWLQYKHLHPKAVEASTASFEDAEFDEFERELAAESAGVLYDTTEVVPYGVDEAPVFLEAPPEFAPAEWEDV